MFSFSALDFPWPSIPAVFPPIGPVVLHRIALVRRRLLAGNYPLRPGRIAEEIYAFEAGTLAAHASGVAAAVIARLTDGLSRADATGAMALQLEFVEGLQASEIAATLAIDPAALEQVRRHVLDGLRAAIAV